MDIKSDYSWSTHQPLIFSLMEKFSPEYIMELGVGMFSTPCFFKYDFKKYIGIDNDSEWLEHIKTLQSFDGRCELRHHDLGSDISISTFIKNLTDAQKKSITDYYDAVSTEVKKETIKGKLLFVDNFICCRAPAINTLYKNFDVIMLHDTEEPQAIDWYEYYFNSGVTEKFNRYNLRTPTSWTSCFIDKKIDTDLDGVANRVVANSLVYCEQNGITPEGFIWEGPI